MKLNKVFLAAGIFAVAFTSCTNLEVTPDSQYTEDPSKNSGVDPMIVVEAKMADIYFLLVSQRPTPFLRNWVVVLLHR